jgi:hypothetical protein
MKTFKSLTTSMYYGKVDWLVIEHLSAQGRPDSRGGLHCLWCPNKTWTLPLSTSDTLTIVKNELKKRKLWPPKIKRVKNSNKQITRHYKGQFPKTQKTILYVAMLLLEFKDDLSKLRWHFYNTLNCFTSSNPESFI